MPFWSRKPKVAALPPAGQHHVVTLAEAANAAATLDALSAHKTFDWNHYQAMTEGFAPMFASEFNLVPTIRITKGLHLAEPWINACTNAISKQFLSPNFALKKRKTSDGTSQVETVTKHPLLDYLRYAGSEVENPAALRMNIAAEMVLTGNAYLWNEPGKKTKRRLPAERVEPVVKNNKVVTYRLLDRNDLFSSPKALLEIDPEEITHLKLPNPYTPHIGLSLIIATILPVLIDKYGREYVVGFFLRGGSTAGIIQTTSTNGEQLMRLARTLMQAFGGRKNMHADKILPAGTEWKGQGSSFGEMRLVEMLKDNVNHFRAATGCTNTVLGTVDNVNRATAFAEMEVFWLLTILPLQKLICSSIEGSPLWRQFGMGPEWELCFDNSEVPYLDDFDRRLDQDAKLAGTWTLNERRERLGKDPLPEGGDQLAAAANAAPPPVALSFSLANPEKAVETAAPAIDEVAVWKAEETKLQEPTKGAASLFAKEFGAWETIVLDHLQDKAAAVAKIEKRADAFGRSFAEKAIGPAMRAYDSQLRAATMKAFSVVVYKDDTDNRGKLQALRQRAQAVIEDGIFHSGRHSFMGYSKTAMDSIYDFIGKQIEDGKSLTDVAAAVREKFNASYGLDEAYSGQAETIVRTEFGAAVSIAQRQFGSDLASATKRMGKAWVTLGDKDVRESHADVSDQVIEGDSGEVVDMAFGNGLRYPRDPDGEASDVINCRCTIRYFAVEWKD